MATQEERGQLSVIASDRWDRALFTTFTLNLSFFESYVLPELHKAGCNDITVLVDERFYILSLEESSARSVGTSYRLLPIRLANGFFHAKLTYLQGLEQDCLLVGSGNLTAPGFGRQLECLDVLRSQTSPHAFATLADAFQDLMASPGAHLGSAKSLLASYSERARTVARRNNGSANSEPMLLASARASLADQIAVALQDRGPFHKIVALSPFHSQEVGPLVGLGSRLGTGRILVAVDPSRTDTPVAAGIKGVSFVRMARPEERRVAHAKWYEFHGDETWLACGSANATQQSLGTTNNFEVLTLRRVNPEHLPNWRSVRPSATGVKPPPIVGTEAAQTLIAEAESEHSVGGQFLVSKDTDGTWRASLQIDNLVYSIGSVVVEQGKFKVRIASELEVDGLSSCQILLERKGVLARGWVTFPETLAMSRERRDFVRRLRKLASADAEHDDFLDILGWLAAHVEGFSSGGIRHPGTGSSNIEREAKPTTVGRFDYGRYAAAARDAPHLHHGELGQIQAALKALGDYRRRAAERTTPGRFEESDAYGDDVEEAGKSPVLGSEEERDDSVEEDLFRKLRTGLQRRLAESALGTRTRLIFIEAFLWALVLENRRNRTAPLDAIPFMQWRAAVDGTWAVMQGETEFLALCIAAMACAWSLRENNDARMEQVATLASAAAQGLPEELRAELVDRAFESCPAFYELSAEQLRAAKASCAALLAYRGFRHQLRDFLIDWNANPSLKPPADLDLKTGGLLSQLTRAHQQSDSVVEWWKAMPDVCRCYHRFEEVDRPEIRNRRAIKCRSCGRFHFWTGIER